jgi:hypothetical protein
VGHAAFPWLRIIRRLPFMKQLKEALRSSTPTLLVHEFPGDYYRFSLQAFREVLLEGLKDVEIRSVMIPPRIIGAGIKP